jgi:hypothetical protein
LIEFTDPTFFMKSDKIRRGIVSRHAGTTGDSIGLSRMSRLRDVELPGSARKSRRGEVLTPAMQAHRKRMIRILSWVFTLTTLAVIGGFMMVWLRLHKNTTPSVTAGYTEAQVRIVSQFDAPSEAVALDLVKQALANRDPEKVGNFFRLGSVSPADSVAFIVASETQDGAVERYDWLSSMDVDGLPLEGVLVTYAGKSPSNERLAFLTPDAKGIWKVDFEAFARTHQSSWKDFMDRRENQMRGRVFVAKDYYFNGVFQNDSSWICFAISSPEARELLLNDPHQLLGYCKTGSPQALAMEQIFVGGEQINRATIEIRRVDGSDSRQFEITRVLAQDWVLPDKPLDEKFH